LQSKFFSRQIFLLYFGKGIFGGKNLFFTQKSEFTLQRRFFQKTNDEAIIWHSALGQNIL
jgi:hypothetical protein